MRVEEFAAKYRANCDHFIGQLNSDISKLNEKQLNYSPHIKRCSIRQIMEHLVKLNNSLISAIEQAVSTMKTGGMQADYKRGGLAKMAIRHAEHIHCYRGESGQDHEYIDSQDENIFLILVKQQNKLKELIALCEQADINKKVIPFWFFGLLKLSIGETLEYLFICQKSHFRLAKQIMMLL